MKEKFKKIEKKILSSPIRKKLKSNRELPLEVKGEEINEIDNDFYTLLNRIERPLNVVVLGEIKSGKSTLVNAIIGDKISPVGVSEATSAIIEFSFDKESKGKLIRKNNETITGKPEDIYDILSKNVDNKKFFRDIKIVQIFRNLSKLKDLHLIDTPGIATINKQNEKITNEFLQEADVILWVFNANFIGQTDINEKLSEVAKLGKPVIGIINKIDEIDSEQESLINFLDNHCGIYLNRIFTLSAYNAWNNLGDNKKLDQTGLNNITKFLEDLNKEAKKTHMDSLKSSLNALLRKDQELHKAYKRKLEFTISQMENFSDKISYHNRRIKDQIKTMLSDWAFNEFLRKEENELIEMTESSSFFSDKKNMKKIQKRIKNIFSTSYLRPKIKEFLEELTNKLKQEWEDSVEEVEKKIQSNIENFREEERVYFAEMDANYLSSTELIKEGTKKGAIIGGSIGVLQGALMAASAVFTMSVFLISIPVMLTAGVLIGGTSKLFDIKKNKRKQIRKIKTLFSRFRNEKIENQLVSRVENKIDLNSDKIAEAIKSNFGNSIFKSYKLKELMKFKNDISKYLDNTRSVL